MASKAGLLANLWFKPNEISLATSIGSTGQIFGTGLGFLVPPFLISNEAYEIDNVVFSNSTQSELLKTDEQSLKHQLIILFSSATGDKLTEGYFIF